MSEMTVDTMKVDTIEQASATPSQEMPYAGLGLARDEYAKIVSILGRRPTDSELYMYSIMWSEHCSSRASVRTPV
jgi:phosphoribosylformylglycinamidine (FGAM) synthase-like enzyme